MTVLRSNLEEEIKLWPVTLLRIFFGYYFLFDGLGKLNSGFTRPGVTPWLRFGDLDCNVADQHDDPDSFLLLTRDLIALRTTTPDLATGAWHAVPAPDGVLAYRRGDATVVALNLGDMPATVDGVTGTVRIGTRRARGGESVAGSVTLGPAEGVVVVLTTP